MSDPSDKTPRAPAPPPGALSDEEATRRARRALLRAGLFAPAVLATLTISQDALAQKKCSCTPPDNCQPEMCKPHGGLC